MRLHRYWIRFQRNPSANAPRPGCGVTAHNYDDALTILRETVFRSRDMLPPIENFIEDIDISSLDQKHVLPNMDTPVWRGVWYPRGYAFPR
jgi:hypothetical protein